MTALLGSSLFDDDDPTPVQLRSLSKSFSPKSRVHSLLNKAADELEDKPRPRVSRVRKR